LKSSSNLAKCRTALAVLLIISYFLINLGDVASVRAAEVGAIASNRPDVQVLNHNTFAFTRLSADSFNNVRTSITGNLATLQLAGDTNYSPRWAGPWQYFGLADSDTLRFDTAFDSLVANWQAEVPLGTAVEVDVRASGDGNNWTLWETLKKSGETAQFARSKAYIFAEYRVRLFSAVDKWTPTFKGITFEANKRDVLTIKADTPQRPPPMWKLRVTRQGMIGGRTANGHIIVERDRFVSMSSWKVLNKKGKYDYQIKMVVPSTGHSAVAPAWDVGPWNNNDNFWHNPRDIFKDLPVGMPQAEAAFFNKHNGGKNEFGNVVLNPSAIDIGDGTYWDELKLAGAQWAERLEVTFLFEGAIPAPAEMLNVQATDIGSGTATVRFKSSTPIASWVEYGFEPGNYPFKTSVNANLKNDHAFFIQGLVPNKTYHFRIRGKDTYGTETTSGNNSFKTGEGQTATLNLFSKDSGIGVKASPDNKNLSVAGGRTNFSLWNDNPKDDFYGGALTTPFALRNIGALDVDFNPTCDEKGQNCAFGFGSGYKAYVKISNGKGDYLHYGVINSVGLSPNAMMLYVEGVIGGKNVGRYYKPDDLATNRGYHFQFVWQNGRLDAIFDHFTRMDTFDFELNELQVSFNGAARFKDDVIAVNFDNIQFSFGTVLEKKE
jgi:hypothetical protein